MPGNGRPDSFKVRLSDFQKERVRQELENAQKKGDYERCIRALRQIDERLRRDPLVFGEQLYTLRVGKLPVRQAMIAPVVVDNAVHEARRLVFIRGFTFLI